MNLLVVPAAGDAVSARASTLRRRMVAGGITAAVIGALRVELARWFTSEPAFDILATFGELELRRYRPQIEAFAQIDDPVLERAIDHGCSRLACYTCGANQTGELIERTTPILTTMCDGHYKVSFMMPPGRELDDLPRPDHPGIELRRVPAREIAALRFRGPVSDANIAAHRCVLMQQLVYNGLSMRGRLVLASFDSPATLSILRRNELWIEVV